MHEMYKICAQRGFYSQSYFLMPWILLDSNYKPLLMLHCYAADNFEEWEQKLRLKNISLGRFTVLSQKFEVGCCHSRETGNKLPQNDKLHCNWIGELSLLRRSSRKTLLFCWKAEISACYFFQNGSNLSLQYVNISYSYSS